VTTGMLSQPMPAQGCAVIGGHADSAILDYVSRARGKWGF